MSRTAQFTVQCQNCKGTEEVMIRVVTKGPFVVKAGDWCVAAAKHLHWEIGDGKMLCAMCGMKDKPAGDSKL